GVPVVTLKVLFISITYFSPRSSPDLTGWGIQFLICDDDSNNKEMEL
ncbi:MAG: hypothetical protein ACI9W7_001870, partial [Porticoccaceae bacterium]